MGRSAHFIGLSLMLALSASPARGCPFCVSETGKRVRAGIFNADFGYNLLVTSLPFSVFLVIVVLIHFGWPWGSKRLTDRITPSEAGAAEELRHLRTERTSDGR